MQALCSVQMTRESVLYII